MYLCVSANEPAKLCDPDNFRRLHVEVVGEIPESDLIAALAFYGRADGEYMWLDREKLRSEVGRSASGAWEQDFEKMMSYAQSSGWMNDAFTEVRAHIVRNSGSASSSGSGQNV